MKELYLEIYDYGEDVVVSVETVTVLFVLKYLRTTVPLVLVRDVHKSSNVVIPSSALNEFQVRVVQKSELCEVAKRCILPAICSEENMMFIMGLCAVLRRILKHAKENGRDEISSKLLGFRGGCLTACAEVSLCTKFCEVDLLNTTKAILSSANCSLECPSIPVNVLRFEAHLQLPVKTHNISKKQQDLAKVLKGGQNYKHKNPDSSSSVAKSLEHNSNPSEEECEENKNLPPWLRIKPRLVRLECSENGDQLVEDLIQKLSSSYNEMNLNASSGTYLPQLIRIFAEGMDMTLADIIIFTYIHLILICLPKYYSDLKNQIDLILNWYRRLMLDENIIYAMKELNFKLDLIETINNHSETGASVGKNPDLWAVLVENVNEIHSSGIQRSLKPGCSKAKMFTRQSEIDNVFAKIKESNIEVVYSQHPCENLALDWTALPDIAHPSFGELPNSRILRKCQQVENLASAILQMSKHGDVIVDFCSGGGHLGVVLAYLLPRCQVIMIDNKEESLIRAQRRVQALGLTNAVLYQSNLDYFTGHFDIGTSLHACGVATDLVLKRCIDENAAFVVCPCCYGAVKNNHLITYPRSESFKQIGITYEDYQVLGHSADQTHVDDPKTEQGKLCMGLIDTDRLNQAMKFEYKRFLCTLSPITCTPKNNLLIGIPSSFESLRNC